MATWELQLISRIVRCNELHTAVQWGVTEDDFLTNESRALYRTITSYAAMSETRGSVLGPSAMQAYFPSFQLCDDPSMTTEALCVEVRKHRLSIDFKGHVQKSLELCEVDPMRAINMLGTGMRDLQNLGMSKSVDVHFSSSWNKSVQRSIMVAQGHDFSCGRWLWSPLQRATMGLQEDDYVVFYGRPKSMKSWVLAANIANFFDQQKRMIIYTKEMTPDNVFQRVGCCLAGVDYDRFRHGTCTREEWMAVQGTQRLVEYMTKEKVVVCLNGQDAPKGGDTVDWLGSKIEQYKPEVVFIDGMYLMSDSRGAKKMNERVRNISEGLRNTILKTRTPIVATLQANRDAAKNTDANLDEIGFSDAIGQDATLLIRVINEHKSGRPTLALVVGGAREANISGFRIWGQPASNFNDYGGPGGTELTAKDVEQARTDDASDDTKPNQKQQDKKKSNGMTEGKAVVDVTKRIDRMVA